MKFPFSSKLLPLPITLRISRSGVRPLRCSCWAFCAAFFLLFSAVSSAELTQQEVEDAVYNALISAPISFNEGAINTVPWMYPVFDTPIGEWLVYSSGYGSDGQYQYTLRSDLLLILAAIRAQSSGDTNLLQSLLPYLASISGDVTYMSGQVSSMAIDVLNTSVAASNIADDMSDLSSFLSLLYESDHWRVHDSELQTALLELQTALLDSLAGNRSSVDGISEGVGVIAESVGGMYYFLSDISGQLASISDTWLTKAQLEEVIDSQEQPPHDEPPDDTAEREQASASAQYEWERAESTSYSNKWELASWEYNKMLPGNASIMSDNPSDNPGGTGFSPDDSGFPLFSRAVVAEDFGMTIDSSVLEPNDYSIFMSYYQEFRVRWARIFHAVWDFISAFMVFFVARREWKYYMGVGDNSPEVETDAGGIF